MTATKGTAIGPDQPVFPRDGPLLGTRRSFLALIAALMGPAGSAQDDVEGRGKSKARLEVMRRLAKEVKIREIDEGKPGPPLPLELDPLLRYSDPARNCIDGTLWGWGERGRGRPPAVMKLELRGPGAAGGAGP